MYVANTQQDTLTCTHLIIAPRIYKIRFLLVSSSNELDKGISFLLKILKKLDFKK